MFNEPYQLQLNNLRYVKNRFKFAAIYDVLLFGRFSAAVALSAKWRRNNKKLTVLLGFMRRSL
jgi:hypothetical protein